jgi:hypothetical protein
MIKSQVNRMINLAIALKKEIADDIQDVKNANHEKLLERNDLKLELMNQISESQKVLNQILVDAINNGADINEFREDVDLLEFHLRELYELNGKLASIVLPVKEMYRQIIDEITTQNGGMLFEVKA